MTTKLVLIQSKTKRRELIIFDFFLPHWSCLVHSAVFICNISILTFCFYHQLCSWWEAWLVSMDTIILNVKKMMSLNSEETGNEMRYDLIDLQDRPLLVLQWRQSRRLKSPITRLFERQLVLFSLTAKITNPSALQPLLTGIYQLLVESQHKRIDNA